MYGISGREITKYTVIYGVYTWNWPTLLVCVHVFTRVPLIKLEGCVFVCVACTYVLGKAGDIHLSQIDLTRPSTCTRAYVLLQTAEFSV